MRSVQWHDIKRARICVVTGEVWRRPLANDPQLLANVLYVGKLSIKSPGAPGVDTAKSRRSFAWLTSGHLGGKSAHMSMWKEWAPARTRADSARMNSQVVWEFEVYPHAAQIQVWFVRYSQPCDCSGFGSSCGLRGEPLRRSRPIANLINCPCALSGMPARRDHLTLASHQAGICSDCAGGGAK